MAFAVGKRVVAESESTDRRPAPVSLRTCCEAIPRLAIASAGHGHESIYTPASGALRAERRPKRRSKRRHANANPT